LKSNGFQYFLRGMETVVPHGAGANLELVSILP